MKRPYKSLLYITTFALCIIIQSCSKKSTDDNDIEKDNDGITVCENGFADIYPCNNYDLMSQIPLTTFGATAGNDCWGWTDAITGNEYALLATNTNVSFVDITEPTNPIYLGNLPTETVDNSWRDVKVYDNYAFIVADNVGAHGMQVFDLTQLRNVANPPEVFAPNTVYTGVDSCHNIVINEEKGYAYLVGCDTFGGGPNFIDISNPLNPIGVGGYADDGYSHDAQVVTYNGPDAAYTDKEIYLGSNEDELVIVDITDKTNPVNISTISYNNVGYTHQGWFTKDMDYFILGDETDEMSTGTNTRTLIFDLTDLDNPIFHSEYIGPSEAIDHNGYVKDDIFYLANYRAGLRMLDISNISSTTNSMTEIAYFDTYPDNDATSFDGVWSVYPFFESGNIVISDINRGLFVIRKSGL